MKNEGITMTKHFMILISFLLLLALFAHNVQAAEPYNIFDQFIPSGYMGDTKNIIVKKNYKDSSQPDSLCTKISYSPGQEGWGGVYWQYPADNWCKKRGKNLSASGYTKATFWVKGERGGEEVKFRVGHDCGDSFVSEEITRRLNTKWEKVTINFEKADLSNITGAFCWVADSKTNEGNVVFYLKDAQFE